MGRARILAAGRSARIFQLPAAAILAMAVASACGQTTPAAATIAPTSSHAPTRTGPCVDIADLADQGDPAENAMATVASSLKGQKVDQARAAAATAAVAMRSLAGLVGSASPAAKSQFLAAANEIEQAAVQFPAGANLVDQAQADLEKAFVTARESACPA